MRGKRGVYFLSNNKVYEPTVAFLNSFRKYNREMELCFIPFDDNTDQILRLQNEYDFSIYDDEYILRQCDFISKQFHGNSLGAYRKLAIWEGKYEEFAYIDIDTVVLSDINFAFDHLAHTEIFTSHSNVDEIRQWVWKDTIFNTNVLSREQVEYAANTGFIVSTRSVLNLEYAYSRLSSAISLKEHMTLMCMEQPFLNYLIVTSGKKYGSLREFTFQKVGGEIKLEMWAGVEGLVTRGGRLIYDPKQIPIFLLHWAGPWLGPGFEAYESMPLLDIWKHYRFLRPGIS